MTSCLMIASDWLDDVSWAEQKVYVELTQGQVKDSPEYNPIAPVDRSYERIMYNYCGIPPYWREKIEEEHLAK